MGSLDLACSGGWITVDGDNAETSAAPDQFDDSPSEDLESLRREEWARAEETWPISARPQ